MKRPITIALAFAVAIVLPVATAIAANGNGRGNGNGKGQVKSFTAKQCNTERKADSGAFQAAFADLSGEHAMRNCKRETTSEVNSEFKNAAQECAFIRAGFIAEFGPEDGTLAFIEEFSLDTNLPPNDKAGLNGKGFMRNAFGKCVSGIVRGAIEDDVDDFQSAAQQCRVDRATDPDLFLETWGNNLTDAQNNAQGGANSRGEERKAFGKCISSTARGLEQEVEAPTPEEEAAPAV
jgi:hypothetical protein